jgi:hypothetical protein
MKIEKHFKEWKKLDDKVQRRKKWSDLVSKIYSSSNDVVKEAKDKLKKATTEYNDFIADLEKRAKAKK